MRRVSLQSLWRGCLVTTRYNRYIAALPELRIVSERTWDIIVYTLNGIIFLILGIELPVAMTDTIADHEVSTFQALGFVVVVYLGILIVRTLWIYGCMLLAKRSKEGKASWRAALLSGISGVRGAITLVGVLAVPAALSNGDAFPERSLMLFIAAGVVGAKFNRRHYRVAVSYPFSGTTANAWIHDCN